MKLTRQDLIQSAQSKPLHLIKLMDVRGSGRDLAEANALILQEGHKARILKDRQGQYLHLPKDELGLVEAAQIKPAFAV